MDAFFISIVAVVSFMRRTLLFFEDRPSYSIETPDELKCLPLNSNLMSDELKTSLLPLIIDSSAFKVHDISKSEPALIEESPVTSVKVE